VSVEIWVGGDEAGLWCSVVHAAALVVQFCVVGGKILVKDGLHFTDVPEAGPPPLNPEVLVEQDMMGALGDPQGAHH
jgi:hypothetical protein